MIATTKLTSYMSSMVAKKLRELRSMIKVIFRMSGKIQIHQFKWKLGTHKSSAYLYYKRDESGCAKAVFCLNRKNLLN